ncbi:MAG: HAD family hydrolase, partial [Clostridia bacterium]|nr:HAD family hydrolase [Clostridia bacterium]
LFPHMATESRIRWTGLSPDEFELYTVFETSHFTKPRPEYYLEVTEKLGVSPTECLMVGNDTTDDLSAANLGMKVFILTPWLINKNNTDLTDIPHGNFDDLISFIEKSERKQG